MPKKKLLFAAIALFLLGGGLLIFFSKYEPTLESKEVFPNPDGNFVASLEVRTYGDGWFVGVPLREVWLKGTAELEKPRLLFSIDEAGVVETNVRWLGGRKLSIEYTANAHIYEKNNTAASVVVEYKVIR